MNFHHALNKYKESNKIFIVTIVSNKVYCFLGYWIEEVKPGILTSIFYEKSKQKINNFKDFREDSEEFIKGINSEYIKIKKEINDLF